MARTKGSKNGISRTKGYTAVGQRAKGRWVNGRYVYDLPKFSSGAAQNPQYSRVVTNRINDPTLSEAYITTGDGRKIYEKEPRRKESNSDIGYDAYREYKRREELKEDARAKQAAGKKAVAVRNGAQNNWQQQAADAQRKAEAKARWNAGNKAQAAKKSAEQGAQNNWQQKANAKRDDVETYRKYKEGSINGIAYGTSVMQHPKDERDPTRWTEIKPMTKTASGAKGKLNNWQQQAAKAATEGTVPASYNWKQYNSLKIKSENRKKRDAENSKKFGKANNWQQTANKAAAAGVRNAMVTNNAANAKKKNYQDTLAKGAAMGDAAKAADAQRKAEAKARWQAGNKAMAANKAKTQGAQNNWQQRANETASNRMLYSKWREGSVNATTSHAYMTPNGNYNPWVADAAKGSSRYMKRKIASNKAKEDARKAWKKLFSKKKKKK